MKNKIHVVICIAFIVTAIAIPFAVEWLLSVTSWSFGSSDGWLGFWSGYLGSIISICFAYFNTKHQAKIDRNAKREKEEKQLLPYFYIDDLEIDRQEFRAEKIDDNGNVGSKCVWKGNFSYKTFAPDVMIEYVNAALYTKHKFIEKVPLGHIPCGKHPVSFEKELSKNDYEQEKNKTKLSVWLDDLYGLRLDISCITVLGNEIFYTYGNGANGTGYYRSKGKWHIYLGNESDESKKRLNEYKKQ